jgi:glycine oxidase
VLVDAESVVGVRCGDREIRAPIVILAAGHASGLIGGIAAQLRPAVRPVKGQILRLRTRTRTPLSSRAVRAVTRGHAVYVVPRSDGRVVVGATVEELGTDTTVTAEACYELLRDAIAVLPILGELELVEAIAGLRPGSPDNAPLLGPSGIDGLIFATGHYRNGILLAPVTAEVLVGMVETGEVPQWARPFSPDRALGVTAAAAR